MRWLNWGKQHKTPSSIALKKEIRGHDAVLVACTEDPLWIYNQFIRIHTLEHPVDELNERQIRAVQKFKARQEGAVDQTTDTHISV